MSGIFQIDELKVAVESFDSEELDKQIKLAVESIGKELDAGEIALTLSLGLEAMDDHYMTPSEKYLAVAAANSYSLNTGLDARSLLPAMEADKTDNKENSKASQEVSKQHVQKAAQHLDDVKNKLDADLTKAEELSEGITQRAKKLAARLKDNNISKESFIERTVTLPANYDINSMAEIKAKLTETKNFLTAVTGIAEHLYENSKNSYIKSIITIGRSAPLVEKYDKLAALMKEFAKVAKLRNAGNNLYEGSYLNTNIEFSLPIGTTYQAQSKEVNVTYSKKSTKAVNSFNASKELTINEAMSMINLIEEIGEALKKLRTVIRKHTVEKLLSVFGMVFTMGTITLIIYLLASHWLKMSSKTAEMINIIHLCGKDIDEMRSKLLNIVESSY